MVGRAGLSGMHWRYPAPLAYSIFSKEKIRPFFCEDYIKLPFFWERNVAQIAGCKLLDKKQYDEQLEQAFRNSPIQDSYSLTSTFCWKPLGSFRPGGSLKLLILGADERCTI